MSDVVKPITRDEWDFEEANIEGLLDYLNDALPEAAETVRRLVATAKQGAEDTARLDWMEQHRPNLNYSIEFDAAGNVIDILDPRIEAVEGDTLGMSSVSIRDAIDSARSSTLSTERADSVTEERR